MGRREGREEWSTTKVGLANDETLAASNRGYLDASTVMLESGP